MEHSRAAHVHNTHNCSIKYTTLQYLSVRCKTKFGERRHKLHNLRTALANNAARVPTAKLMTRNTGCFRQNSQLLYKLCNYKTNTLVTITPPFSGNNKPVTLTTFWCFLSAEVQVCLQLNTNWQRRPINIAVPNQRLHLLTVSQHWPTQGFRLNNRLQEVQGNTNTPEHVVSAENEKGTSH